MDMILHWIYSHCKFLESNFVLIIFKRLRKIMEISKQSSRPLSLIFMRSVLDIEGFLFVFK